MSAPYRTPPLSEVTAAIAYWRDEWELSTRICNALAEDGIGSVDALRALGKIAFLRIPNIGKKSAKEVDEVIGWEGPPPPPPVDQLARIVDALHRIAEAMEKRT